jgi:Glycosyl transferase family 2
VNADASPRLAVVVPTRGRPLRVRWLLNELEARSDVEVVVAHPPGDPAAEVVSRHPLGRAGRARAVVAANGRAGARNAGWRAARAPLIAFTHDDCRPDPRWVDALLRGAREVPDAIVQGTVRPDPEQGAFLYARLKRVHQSTPPDVLAPLCSVAFPRELLESLGGFAEEPALGGVDGAELTARARDAGAPVRPAPDAVALHAVRPLRPGEWLGGLRDRGALPFAVSAAPGLRSGLKLGVAVRWTHLLAPGALAAAGLVRRHPAAAALAAPWAAMLVAEELRRGGGLRRAVCRLPLRGARDLGELALLSWGSVRARTLCL